MARISIVPYWVLVILNFGNIGSKKKKDLTIIGYVLVIKLVGQGRIELPTLGFSVRSG
jgi:hypothetical protein